MPKDELNVSGNHTGEELEGFEARIAELEGVVAQQEEELKARNSHLSEVETRVTELEQTVADRDKELVTLKQSNLESEQKLAGVGNALSQAITSYKDLVIASNAGMPSELIAGDTIEDINASLERTRAIVSKVKQGLVVEMASTRVPAGAPQRTPPDLSALSPREKIQYAIGGNK